MREIKFRAIVPVNSDGPKSMHYFDLSKIDDCNRLSYADYDANALMQYQRMKDKNGVEIYDGDKLQDSSGHIWIVYWYEDHACFGWYSEKFENIRAEIIDNQNTKVIGNIFQP